MTLPDRTYRARPLRLGILTSAALALIFVVALAGISAGSAAATTGHESAPTVSSARAGSAGAVKFYLVRESWKGQREFLFEIAQRFLGDGDRFNEIFKLNKGRLQPDGARLTDPSSINPGWILQMPPDAQGSGIKTGVLPTVTAAPSESPVATGSSGPTTAGAGGSDGSPAALYLIIGVAALVLGGGLIGFALFTRHRSGSPEPQTPEPAARAPGRSVGYRTPPAPAPAATPGLPEPEPGAGRLRSVFRRPGSESAAVRPFDAAAAWTVDRGLRSLTSLAAQAGRPVPPFYAVSLDPEWMQIQLAAPDLDALAPWSATEDGRSWFAPLRSLQALALDEGIVSPSPRLVTLGVDQGARKMLDLGQATGIISIEGNAGATQSLLRGWIGELAAAPWAENVRTVVVGLTSPLPGDPVSLRTEYAPGLREAFATMGWSDRGPVAGVLRGGGHVPASAPGLLIVTGRFRDNGLEQLQALASQPDANWSVVVVGRVPAARWRFTLRPGGRLDTGVLGITVQINDGLAVMGGMR